MADLDTINYQRAIAEADALVEGAIISLTGKQPKLADFVPTDINPFKTEVEKVKSSRDSANAQITIEQDRLGEASTNKKDALRAKAQAEADKTLADHARAVSEAALYEELGLALGVDPSAVAEIAGRLAVERPKAEAMLREIQSMQAVGPMDNPLEWFYNQIQMPAKIQPYNRQADIVNMLQDTLDESLATAQNAATFNAKAIPAITKDQARAAAKVKLTEGAIEAAKADEDLARQNVNFAVQRLSNDIAVANQTSQMTQLQMQQRASEYQASINAINVADTHAKRMLEAAKLLEKLNKEKGLDVILENYDRIMGHPKGTTNRYTFERFGEGQRVNIVAIGAGSGGTDPFQAVINVGMARPGPLFASGKLYAELQNWTENIARLPDVQLLDEKQKPLAISRKLKEEVEKEKLRADTPGGIFYELSPAEMIAANVVPADSALAKLLEPYARANKDPIPTSIVVGVFEKLYENPTLAGAALSDYYRKNIELRNKSLNYSLFAIKPDTTYFTNVRYGDEATGFGLAYRARLDLTNPADATKYILIRRSAQQASRAIASDMGIMP